MPKYIVTYSAQNGSNTLSGRTFVDRKTTIDSREAVEGVEELILDNLRQTVPGASKLFITWFHELSSVTN